MPVVLERGQFEAWFEKGDRDVLKACDSELLAAHPVDNAVGNVRNNGPELIERID